MRRALAAGWVAFAFLLVGTSPAHHWLDTGEIAAAGAELGVVHPPGAPGLVLLLHLATAVPVGSLGFRMAIVSSALMAAAVVVAVQMLVRRGAHGLVTWGVVAWILSSITLVRQARVVEIYAYGTCLLAVVLACFDPAVPERWRGRYRLVGCFFATVAAWGIGDLRLALAPWLVVAWARGIKQGHGWWRFAPLVVTAASVAVLSMSLAAARDPIACWGDPDTLLRLWPHVQATSIRAAYADDILPASLPLWIHNAMAVADMLDEDLGPLGPVTVLLCLAVLLGRRRTRKVGIVVAWLAAAEVFYAIGINPMGVTDRQTGVATILLAALVVGLALHELSSRAPRLRWAALPLSWTVLVLPPALTNGTDLLVTRSWAPHRWSSSVLSRLPPRALLLTQSDDLAAGVLALRVLEGARPDVAAIPAQHLHKGRPGHVDDGHPGRFAWDAAAQASTEVDRIRAAIAAHPGPVALEHARSGLFQAVAFWSPHGGLPIAVHGPGAKTSTVELAADVDRWLPQLPTVDDRQRLAVAVSNWARAMIRAWGDDGISMARWALEITLHRIDPDHASALVALGSIYDHIGRTEEAIALTRRALALEPGRSAALTNLALYLSRNPESRSEALEMAERAVALRPWQREAWLRLADVRQRAGDQQGAQQAREEARNRPSR